MSRFRSTMILYGFVSAFSALTFLMWLYFWVPPVSLGRLALASVVFGGMFGGLAWSLLTTPAARPRNDGWRKYRFFMWWAALIVLFETAILTKGYGFRFWSDFVPVFGISLTLTTIGWALGSLRAERAAQMADAKHHEMIRPKSLK